MCQYKIWIQNEFYEMPTKRREFTCPGKPGDGAPASLDAAVVTIWHPSTAIAGVGKEVVMTELFLVEHFHYAIA